MEGKFYGMYMNHPDKKHDEWAEENNRNIESYKRGRSQRTMDGEKSTGNIGSCKILILSSQMQSELCTDFGIYQADKKIGIYKQ